MKIDNREINRRACRIYERALNRLDDISLSLDDMERLFQKDRETSRRNKDMFSGTPYEKHECPFDLCDGKKGVVIVDREEVYGAPTVLKCPCVDPEGLREYRNKKPERVHNE